MHLADTLTHIYTVIVAVTVIVVALQLALHFNCARIWLSFSFGAFQYAPRANRIAQQMPLISQKGAGQRRRGHRQKWGPGRPDSLRFCCALLSFSMSGVRYNFVAVSKRCNYMDVATKI